MKNLYPSNFFAIQYVRVCVCVCVSVRVGVCVRVCVFSCITGDPALLCKENSWCPSRSMGANTITHDPVMALPSIVGKSSSRLETNVQVLKLRTPVLLVGSINCAVITPSPGEYCYRWVIQWNYIDGDDRGSWLWPLIENCIEGIIDKVFNLTESVWFINLSSRAEQLIDLIDNCNYWEII